MSEGLPDRIAGRGGSTTACGEHGEDREETDPRAARSRGAVEDELHRRGRSATGLSPLVSRRSGRGDLDGEPVVERRAGGRHLEDVDLPSLEGRRAERERGTVGRRLELERAVAI